VFTGETITYDARNSHYDLTGSTSDPRVTARIAPRIDESAEQAHKPADPGAKGRNE